MKMLSLMANIVVSDRDRWASRYPRSLGKGWACEVVTTSDARTAADRKLRGLSANSLCPIVIDLIMVALCAQQVYPPILLYHWKGLTGIGLVLVHPNIIIYYGIS